MQVGGMQTPLWRTYAACSCDLHVNEDIRYINIWCLHAGGWHADTTVEDMDLSIRAFAAGWKFKYLDHVGCYSELPSTMQAYKTQQYRWQSGPMQVCAL